ncbi:hypothetical protein PF005_g17276 [Phytophthora fragariae]|uniref:Kinesin motor domain-containing protein n=1 Tax=Phytophthora fragariae TaxID=53985 RepID=A0A6A3X306_9STRA|nr:hypothetical protein PF003_g23056 [Phytophthora fragariae]KAE9195475.1 hypothetical protein PF005_g17276 [Phytophthora fragariae]KAE9209821.1 hypothetical protein PF004_g16358 [Phytophthora fragariae]
MTGGSPRHRFEDRGLIARALSRVFQRTQQDADHSYTLRVSYLEIYNDRLIDILAPDVSSLGTGNALKDLASRRKLADKGRAGPHHGARVQRGACV